MKDPADEPSVAEARARHLLAPILYAWREFAHAIPQNVKTTTTAPVRYMRRAFYAGVAAALGELRSASERDRAPIMRAMQEEIDSFVSLVREERDSL